MPTLTILWLNPNKTSLNVEKSQTSIFLNVREKELVTEIKIKLNRKRLNPSQSVKYFGIKIDQNLNWKDRINDIAVKSNRANSILFKIKTFVNVTILKVSTLHYLIITLITQIWFGLRIQIL